LVAIARAILRAFVWDEGQPMRSLADDVDHSPTTFYAMLRLAIRALMWVRRCKESVEVLDGRIRDMQARLTRMEQAYAVARGQVQSLTRILAEAQSKVVSLEAQVAHLQAQWTVCRRYTHQMDHFGTSAATQCFFDLFAFYHNVHTLRAGNRAGHSLLTAAHTDVKKLFGTDDPYTILGFPPAASQTFIPLKSVQSSAV